METSAPLQGCCRLATVELMEVWLAPPARPGLSLVWEATVKGGEFVVLEFGLDVFCMVLTPKEYPGAALLQRDP